MTVTAGRVAEVYVSTNGITYVPVERVINPRCLGEAEKAETSSNDSAGNKEWIYTWAEMSLLFSMVADEAAAGQEILWTAFRAGSELYVKVWQSGDTDLGAVVSYRGLVTALGLDANMREAVGYQAKIDCVLAPPGGIRTPAQEPEPLFVEVPEPDLYVTMDAADIAANVLGGHGTSMLFITNSGVPGDFSVPGSLPGKTAIRFNATALHQYGLVGAGSFPTHSVDYSIFMHAKTGGDFGFLLSSFFTLGSHHIEQFFLVGPTRSESQQYSTFRNNGPPNWTGFANFGASAPALDTWFDVGQVINRAADTVEAFTDGVSVGSAALPAATHGVALYDLGASTTFAARVSAFTNVYADQTMAEVIIWKRTIAADVFDTMHRLRLAGTSLKQHNGY